MSVTDLRGPELRQNETSHDQNQWHSGRRRRRKRPPRKPSKASRSSQTMQNLYLKTVLDFPYNGIPIYGDNSIHHHLPLRNISKQFLDMIGDLKSIQLGRNFYNVLRSGFLTACFDLHSEVKPTKPDLHHHCSTQNPKHRESSILTIENNSDKENQDDVIQQVS